MIDVLGSGGPWWTPGRIWHGEDGPTSLQHGGPDVVQLRSSDSQCAAGKEGARPLRSAPDELMPHHKLEMNSELVASIFLMYYAAVKCIRRNFMISIQDVCAIPTTRGWQQRRARLEACAPPEISSRSSGGVCARSVKTAKIVQNSFKMDKP